VPSNDLALEDWRRDSSTTIVGRPLLFYDQVGSTNDLAKQRARAGDAEGLVVLADEQTAGRGRQGRAWAAPPGSSLLMSLLLRPSSRRRPPTRPPEFYASASWPPIRSNGWWSASA
jgi:hypothetical protein